MPLPDIKMTLGLQKPAIETIIKEYVNANYPGYEVERIDFKFSMSGGSQRDDGYSVFSGVDISLRPLRIR